MSSGWFMFEHDPMLGRTVWACEQDDGLIFKTTYQAQETIDANKRFLAATENERFGDYARLASVPLNVFYDSGLSEAGNQGDDKYIAKYLNDPDNRAWRTSRGRV